MQISAILAFIVGLLAVLTLPLVSHGESTDDIPLQIHQPLDFVKTNISIMTVEGHTAANLTVNVTRESSAGTKVYTTTSGPDGLFDVEVELLEGIQKLIVEVFNASGNSTVDHRSVMLDTTNPKWVLTQPPENPWWTREATYTIEAANFYEGLSDVFIDDVHFENTSSISHTVVLKEGENVFEFKAVDKVGNTFSFDIIIHRDSTPPELSVSNPMGEVFVTNLSYILLNGTVSDTSGPVKVRYLGSDYTATRLDGLWTKTASWECLLMMDTNHADTIVEVNALDKLGNEASFSIHVILDRAPPRLEVDPTPEFVKDTMIFVNGTTDQDVSMVEINDMLFPVVDGTFNVLLALSRGRNYLNIHIKDAFGNHANETILVYYVVYGPLIEINAPERTELDRIRINGTVDKDVTSVLVEGNLVEVVNGTFEITVELEPGENSFLVEATDSHGNTNAEVVRVERETPGFSILLVLSTMAMIAVAMRVRGRFRR